MAQPHCIALGCDFFYPRMGGVEQHIFCLAQALLRRGLRVFVVTGRYAPRVGLRVMAGGLRVYYLPHVPMVDQASLPTYIALLPLLRAILLRERTTIVHGHAATSVFTHDFLLAARALGLPAVYTDHSLFGAGDAASVCVSRYLSLTLADVQACIAVSHASADNLSERARLPRGRVVVIPNAIDCSQFTPDPIARAAGIAHATRALTAGRALRTDGCGDSKAVPEEGTVVPRTTVESPLAALNPAPPTPIVVVMISRLVFRKGCDLAAALLPAAAARFPHVTFLIGGDGPKRTVLERAAIACGRGRVEFLGPVPHAHVRDVLARGAIFLNCSLTESFCIAILEAAAAGCHVVSTNVGGVPEVLPSHMATLADPEQHALLDALGAALPRAAATDPLAQHAEIRALYSWDDIARRTSAVYDDVAATPPPALAERFVTLLSLGPVFGPIAAIIAALSRCLVLLLEWCAPESEWDAAGGVEEWSVM